MKETEIAFVGHFKGNHSLREEKRGMETWRYERRQEWEGGWCDGRRLFFRWLWESPEDSFRRMGSAQCHCHFDLCSVHSRSPEPSVPGVLVTEFDVMEERWSVSRQNHPVTHQHSRTDVIRAQQKTQTYGTSTDVCQFHHFRNSRVRVVNLSCHKTTSYRQNPGVPGACAHGNRPLLEILTTFPRKHPPQFIAGHM